MDSGNKNVIRAGMTALLLATALAYSKLEDRSDFSVSVLLHKSTLTSSVPESSTPKVIVSASSVVADVATSSSSSQLHVEDDRSVAVVLRIEPQVRNITSVKNAT